MKELSNSLKDKISKYHLLDNNEKTEVINELYHNINMSWGNIASLVGTYTNKIRREAIKLGIKSRDKSDAQKVSLSEGRHKHPTKDKGHNQKTKVKISESLYDNWSNLPEEERGRRKEIASQKWQEKTEDEIREIRTAAAQGVREAAKYGSSFEKYLLEHLIKHNFKVEFHKEHWIVRERLQIDLFLPELNVAIEVDGPTHFEDIWGEKALRKNQERDNEKNGLLMHRGCIIIRIKQTKQLTQKYKRDTLNELLSMLKSIKEDRPKYGDRIIIIGE